MEMLNFKSEGVVELYVDQLGGSPFATFTVNNGDKEIKTPVAKGPTGVHDVYLFFRGGDGELFDIDWWKIQ